MTVDATRPRRVLLVNDDELDIGMLRKAMDGASYIIRPEVVTSGEEALAYLLQQGRFHNRTSPDVVLLDIRMPGISGIETFRAMKGDERIARVPVVMLVGSSHDEDMVRAFTEGAQGYLIKPVSPVALDAILQGL